MRAFIRNVFIVFFILLIILLGAFFYLIRSPKAVSWLSQKALKQKFTSASVQINHMDIQFKRPSVFQGVHLGFEDKSGKHDVDIERIQVSCPENKGDPADIRLNIVGLDAESGELSVTRGTVSAELWPKKEQGLKTEGHFDFKKADAYGIGVTDISGDFQSSQTGNESHELTIDNLKLLCYGGSVRGKMKITASKNSVYDIGLDVEGVDLTEVGRDFSALQGQVSGKLSGKIRLSGRAGGTPRLQAELYAPGGGMVKAELLQYITSYLPANSSQYKRLGQMIAEDKMVPLNTAVISLNSLSEETVGVNFDLYSKELNIKPNITVDVNLDIQLHRLPEVLLQHFSRR